MLEALAAVEQRQRRNVWGDEAVTTRKRACAAGDEEKFSTKTRSFLTGLWLAI